MDQMGGKSEHQCDFALLYISKELSAVEYMFFKNLQGMVRHLGNYAYSLCCTFSSAGLRMALWTYQHLQSSMNSMLFLVCVCLFVFCFEVLCGLIKTEQLKILQQSALGQNRTRAVAKVSDFLSGCRATKWYIGGGGGVIPCFFNLNKKTKVLMDQFVFLTSSLVLE